jgi:hypothetical protein
MTGTDQVKNNDWEKPKYLGFTSAQKSQPNLAELRLGLKNRQVGEKWVSDDCSYLCKSLFKIEIIRSFI